MVPASDDSQTNSCLKNPILMRIRAGYSLRLWVVSISTLTSIGMTIHSIRFPPKD